MTSNTIHVNDELWRRFKEKTPRSKNGKNWTMNDAIVELISNHCNYVKIEVEKKNGVQSSND